MKQIAIYGGTFNVLHEGHKAIIKYLSKHFDEVLVIPTNVNYYREDKELVCFNDRLTKIYDFTFDENLNNIKILDVENRYCISRFSGTLRYILEHGEPCVKYTLAMGSDTYNEFKTWYDYNFIYSNCKLLVFNRPGHEIDSKVNLDHEFVNEGFEYNISSTELLNKEN